MSALLSMPCERQACENAQVLQKWRASPSSASTRRSSRGNAVSFTARSTRSDRAGEARRELAGVYGLVEVSVEAHGDITQQQSTPCGREDTAGFPAYEPIRHERCEPVQRIGEIGIEIDRVAPLQRRNRDLSLAHQLLDEVCAQPIVLVQVHAAEDRQTAVVNRDLPAGKVPRVLAEAVADMADRAHAQADQVAVGVGRVAHEVAM